MEFMTLLDGIVGKVGAFAWGPPMLILLVGTGFWLTYSLRGIQFRKLWYALYLALVKRKEETDEPGDITHFQALMTALSATVGTGNIAGVATAVAIGGPGAMFWMWMTGLVGMATKYAEAVLAVKYRVIDENGEMSGGPMYYISKGLKMPWLGSAFAICASVAAFGIGNMVQSNSVADAVEATYQVSPFITGGILMACTAAVILGGIKKIGQVTGLFVPVMIIFYMAGASYIILANIAEVPSALAFIVEQAFNPSAAVGGFAGASIMLGIRMGVARGVFSNESGLGSAPIAAAADQESGHAGAGVHDPDLYRYSGRLHHDGPCSDSHRGMVERSQWGGVDDESLCRRDARWSACSNHWPHPLCLFYHSRMELLW